MDDIRGLECTPVPCRDRERSADPLPTLGGAVVAWGERGGESVARRVALSGMFLTP